MGTLEHQLGRRERAIAELREAVRLAGTSMASYGTIARYRLGRLLGAAEGAALLAEARRWAEEEGVVDLDRFASVYAPGFAAPSQSGRS